MYKALYPVLVQWKLPLGQAAVPVEKEHLLNVLQARHILPIHGKHQKNRWKLAVAVNVFNPNTWEVKTGSVVHDHSSYTVFKASLGYTRMCLKKEIQTRNNQGKKLHLLGSATEPSRLRQLLRLFKKAWQLPPQLLLCLHQPLECHSALLPLPPLRGTMLALPG